MNTGLNHSKPANKSPFQILSKIGQSNQSIYMTRFSDDQKLYALKVYPYQNGQPSHSYMNEKRFTNLAHGNVLSIVRTQCKQKSYQKGTTFYSSYILMELCPYGDFRSLIHKTRVLTEDTKLLRTYFHQLIDGIQYLHAQGVSHLDLKPENL